MLNPGQPSFSAFDLFSISHSQFSPISNRRRFPRNPLQVLAFDRFHAYLRRFHHTSSHGIFQAWRCIRPCDWCKLQPPRKFPRHGLSFIASQGVSLPKKNLLDARKDDDKCLALYTSWSKIEHRRIIYNHPDVECSHVAKLRRWKCMVAERDAFAKP